jgi:hypothetical protein
MRGQDIVRLYRSSLAALFLFVSIAGYAHAASPSVIGNWRWFNPAGSEVRFNANGTAQHFVGGAVADNGIWKETSGGAVDITWSSGFVDHWQISSSGDVMTGQNSNGALPTVSRE